MQINPWPAARQMQMRVDPSSVQSYLALMRYELDATGLLCPLPVLKARKRLQPLNAGDELEMRADDPAAIVDVPHFCAEAGHQLVETREDGDAQVYVIRKA